MTRSLCAALLLAAACRPNPGLPTYADDAMPPPARLTVGAFYVGPASDSIPLDDATRRLDVFSATVASIVTDNRDRVDGQPSFALAHAGQAWWGLGIDWDSPLDLRRWKTMNVALKSSDAAFAAVKIAMDSGKSYEVDATAYGYAGDGAWHVLAIPVADFVKLGFDPAVTRAPFVLSGGAGTAGQILKVAGLYFDEE